MALNNCHANNFLLFFDLPVYISKDIFTIASSFGYFFRYGIAAKRFGYFLGMGIQWAAGKCYL
jgi:hypothetical protein